MTTTDPRSGARLRVEERAINAWGDVIESHIDEDGDGSVDAIVRRDFDDSGHLRRLETDTDADGQVDEAEEWDYELGRLVEHRVDDDADGFADARTLYAYEEDGQLTMRTIDEDGDFDIDFEERREYDDEGRLVQRWIDRDGDEVVDEREDWTWDAHGLVAAFRDVGDDGAAEWAIERTAPPPSRVEVERFDHDGDGDIDETRTRGFGPDDRPRVESIERAGVLVERRMHTYGEHGLIRVGYDRPEAPGGERVIGYDAAGRRTSERLDVNLDGSLEIEHTAAFGAAGPVAETTIHRDVEGQVIQRRILASGDEGRVLRFELDTDADGALDQREIHHWLPDAAEPWLLLQDDDGDGAYDRRTETELTCE